MPLLWPSQVQLPGVSHPRFGFWTFKIERKGSVEFHWVRSYERSRTHKRKRGMESPNPAFHFETIFIQFISFYTSRSRQKTLRNHRNFACLFSCNNNVSLYFIIIVFSLYSLPLSLFSCDTTSNMRVCGKNIKI